MSQNNRKDSMSQKKSRSHKAIPRTVEEDLQSLDESELLEEERKISPSVRKAIIIFGGLLIIFLFLSLIYLQYPLFNVIHGQIESKNVNNNILQLRDFSIIFSDTALSNIRDSFSVNQKVETSRCLKGALRETSDGKTYFITDVYTPKIYDQSFREVISQPCSNDTLIMFHTHPYKSCVASDTDLNTLKKAKEANPDIIMVVMCEKNRFAVYR